VYSLSLVKKTNQAVYGASAVIVFGRLCVAECWGVWRRTISPAPAQKAKAERRAMSVASALFFYAEAEGGGYLN